MIRCVWISILLCAGSVQAEEPTVPDAFAGVERLAAALEQAVSIAREARPASVPRGRAEGALHVVRQLLRAVDEELAWADTRHPYFDDQDTRFAKLALGNPDNLYVVSRVDDGGRYRISGRRGTTSDFAIQIYQGYPGVGRAFDAVGSIDRSGLEVDTDGRFVVFVGGEPRRRNWIPLRPGSRRILVRYTYADWAKEEAGEIRIERLDTRDAATVAPDEAEVERRLDAASFYLLDAVRGYLAVTESIHGPLPTNTLAPLRRTGAGGLAGQFTTNGHYALADDQALIVTTRPSDARYQGFQLGTWWFASLDYVNRQTSLTTSQARRSSDGLYHFVVSTRDPGVPNWLDAGSDPSGLMLLRWQGVSDLGSEHQPRVEFVAFDDIRDHLPRDEPFVTPQQRGQAIAERQAAIARRFGLFRR